MKVTSTKIEALIIFFLLSFMYAYFYHDGAWNGNSRLALTFAIVQEGRLTIDSFHDRGEMFTEDKAIYKGHYYTSKAIGSSLVAVLFYFPLYNLQQLFNVQLPLGLVKYVLTLFSIGIPSAIAGSLIYVLCKQVTDNRFRSYVATVVVTLGTMIFPYSVVFFGHQLVGALLFCAFFLIFQLKINPFYRRKAVLFLIGLLLGFALITEYPVAPIVLVLTIYYMFVMLKKGTMKPVMSIIWPALGGIIPIAIIVAYNVAVFGNAVSTGYTHSAYPWFREHQTQGLVGIGLPNPEAMYYMTLHPAFGIFWQSPVLILSLIGIGFMMRVSNYRSEALITITAFLSLLILYSGFYAWWGAWTFTPRYLVPMLTFLGLPLVFIPRRWFFSVTVLGLISIMQMFIAVATRIIIPDDFIKTIDQVGYFAYSTIYSYCLKLLLNGELSTNLGMRLLDLTNWPSLVLPLLLLLIVSGVFFYWQDKNESSVSLPNQTPMAG